MPPAIVEAIAPLLGLVTVGVFVLAGLRTYLAYKAKRLELGAGGEPSNIEALVEDLRNEVQALRGDIAELHERVDFAERLLTRGSPGGTDG